MSPPPASAHDAPGSVLVVDDDASVRRLVARILATCGHATTTAGGTEEALALLPEGRFDAALVDLDMPGRGGLDFLRAMAATGCDAVPVLLTGTRDVAAAVAGMKHGAFDYLPKPTEPESLRWTVSRAIGVARARRREKALERIVGEWSATFHAAPDLLLVLDAEGRIVRANEGVARRAGTAVADLVGRSVADVFAWGEALRTVRTVPVRVAGATPGEHFLVSVAALPTSGVVAAARDVSELVRAEEAQQRLARQLLTAQDDERGRIARELHDGIGQAVVSLAIGLGALRDGVPAGAAFDRLQKLGACAAETLAEIRRLAHGLRPSVLDDLGLVAALGRLAESFSALHGIRAELVVTSATGRVPRAVESAVYRIVQEALANVAKHAGAATVDVTLEVTASHLQACVTDDGNGFATNPRCDGVGLSHMRERAVMLGGTFRIDSSPGRGTTVDVGIPLAEASA